MACRRQCPARHGLRRRPGLPPPPWRPLLRSEELQRGLAFYGSGARIQRVASKLLAGHPIKAFTIGGSVTRGAGASSPDRSFPERFFAFLNATFPHREHVLQNKGIGASTSGIFSVCAEAIVPPDADLVVAEFTFNEPGDQPFTSPQRRGFEQLLRKLARLPGAPAVVVLHHYAWWFCHGDGIKGGLYYRAAEAQFATLAQYYDMPSPSVRDAAWPLMQAGIPPFKVSHVLKKGQTTPAGVELPVAEPGTEGQYFFYDKVHPSDVGHQVMAELLAGVVLQAVDRVLAAQEAAGMAGEAGPAGGGEPRATKLPPPMIPGNADVPTTLCAMQEDFKPYARAMQGFAFRPERPDAATFVEQKWGYTGDSPGHWVELELSTVDGAAAGGGAGSGAGGDRATVFLGYLSSYDGMGQARVECVSGCKCAATAFDARWKQKVSLTQMHQFKVSQHPRCRVRVTIAQPGDDSSSGGSKVQLNALMVAHFPLAIDQRIAGEAGGMRAENG
ncbi:hypothetical protein ABPG77_000381 [Micractinium sp. CCAP 211/92]